MSVSSTPIHANMAIHLDKVSSCVPVISLVTGVINLIAKAAILKNASSANNEYLNYLAGKSWKACVIQCLPIAGNAYAFVSLLRKEKRPETAPEVNTPTNSEAPPISSAAERAIPAPVSQSWCKFDCMRPPLNCVRPPRDRFRLPEGITPIAEVDTPEDRPVHPLAGGIPDRGGVLNQARLSKGKNEARASILEARDSVFEKLPKKTIKQKALASAFRCIREHIGGAGFWHESGQNSTKRKNLAKINGPIFPRVPKFANPKAAADVAKELIGTFSDKKKSPLLDHTLSFDQITALSKRAAKKKLTVRETDAALKEAFGNDRNKLLMFKAFLILLKETTEHADTNGMDINSLILCPLSPFLQRRTLNSKNVELNQATFLLAKLLIKDADKVLADI